MNTRISATDTNGRLCPRCLGLHAVVLRGRTDCRFGRTFTTSRPAGDTARSFFMALGDDECRFGQRAATAGYAERVGQFFEQLAAFDFHIAPAPAISAFAEFALLATRYQLTAYDAAYLDLARQLALPLATLDEDLKKLRYPKD